MILPELFNIVQKVIVSQNLCVNNRICALQCSKCESVCPHHCVKIDRSSSGAPVVIGENCTGCGLCIAECPTKAIHIDPKVYNSFITKDGITDLFCTRLEEGGFAPCMGLLDAYILVYIGMNSKQVNVSLNHSMCEACNPGIVKSMEKLLCATNEFLQKLDKPAINISFRNIKSGNVNESLNRRDLFAWSFSKLKESFTRIIPLPVEVRQSYRELLLKDMQQCAHEEIVYTGSPLFWGMIVSTKCDLCGVCVRSCKNAALMIKTDESEEKIELFHIQSRCIGCSVCSIICPKSAICVLNEESELNTVIKSLPCSVASRNVAHCNSCGALIVSNEHALCEACQYQTNRRIQTIY